MFQVLVGGSLLYDFFGADRVLHNLAGIRNLWIAMKAHNTIVTCYDG